MRNILFSCPECGQHLDAEAEWGGLVSQCPVCSKVITIPAASDDAQEPAPSQAGFDALKSERDALAGEFQRVRGLLAAEEVEKDALQASLRESRESLAEKEESLKNSQARHESAQIELAQSRRLVAERDAQLQTRRSESEGLMEENQRLAARLLGQEHLAAKTREELDAARKHSETMAADWEETRGQLRETLAARDAAQTERNKLKADLSVSFDLVKFLAIQEKAGELETTLAEAREKLGRTFEELQKAQAEVHRSHEERVRVELELAAAKDALSESKLEQDNAVLRSLVKRLNEELNQYRPLTRRAATKLAARVRAARGSTGFFRWPWSRRLFIPER